MAEAKKSKAPKFPDYSLSRYQQSKQNKSSVRGKRTSTEEKNKNVTKEEHVYPEGIEKEAISVYTKTLLKTKFFAII